MFLILSGEGTSDIGTKDNEIGPMSKIADDWIDRQIGYSLIELNFYTIIPKQQLTKVAKGIKQITDMPSLSAFKNRLDDLLAVCNIIG